METENVPMISLQKFKILYLDFNSRVNNKKYFGAFQLNSVSVIQRLNTIGKTERENQNFLSYRLHLKKIFLKYFSSELIQQEMRQLYM